MAEVELECAVYGEGTVFSVKIALDAKVGALQEAIFGKERYRERFSFSASALTLYLARKNGEWLKDDASLRILLRGAVNTEYEEMRPWWKLKKKKLFGEDFEPGRREIHVLVELPEAATGHASTSSTVADIVRVESKIADIVRVASKIDKVVAVVKELRDEMKQPKVRKYAHSQMSPKSGFALLKKLKMEYVFMRKLPYTIGDQTKADPFEWESIRSSRGARIKLYDEQQRVEYRTYVEQNIGGVLSDKQLCVVGVEKGTNLLSVELPEFNIVLTGCTNLLILSDIVKDQPGALRALQGVKMLIEVKSTVEDNAQFQAMSELIALDALTSKPVMALLTDLVGHWQFFWISEEDKEHPSFCTVVITDPSTAFAAIRTLLAHEPSDGEAIMVPSIQKPVKRRKLDQVLPSISEGGESGGIREAMERYSDIASVLGPDIEMARALGRQVVRTIPAFSHYT